MASTNYTAGIDLTVKVDQAIAAVNALDQRLGNLEKTLTKVDTAGKQTSTTSGGLGNLTNVLGQLTSVSGAAGVALGAIGLGAVAGAAVIATEKLVGFVSECIKAIEAEDNLQFAMASIVGTAVNFQQSMEKSTLVISRLKTMSGETGQGVDILASSLKSLNNALPGATIDQLLKLTEILAYQARLKGLNQEGLASMMGRAISTGTLPLRGDEARALSSMGFDKDFVKNLELANDQAGLMIDKLKVQKEGVDAVKQSWTSVKEEIAVAIEELKEDIGRSFVWVKDVIKDFTELSKTIKEVSGSDFPKLYASIMSIIPPVLLLRGVVLLLTSALKAFQLVKEELTFNTLMPTTTVGDLSKDAQKQAEEEARKAKELTKNQTIAGLRGDISKEEISSSVSTLNDYYKALLAEDLNYSKKQLSIWSDQQITDDARKKQLEDAEKVHQNKIQAIKIASNEKLNTLAQKAFDDLHTITLDGLDGELQKIQDASNKQQQAILAGFLSGPQGKAQLREANDALADVQNKASNDRIEAFKKSSREQYNSIVDSYNQIAVLTAQTYDRAKFQEELDYDTARNILKDKLNDARTGAEERQKINEKLIVLELLHSAKMKEIAKSELGDIQKIRVQNQEEITKLLNTGTTAAEGTRAGMLAIFNTLKTETERTFEFITGLWGDLGKNIETSIYQGLTGNENFLKTFFKGIADDFAKRMATSLKDTIMPLLAKGLGALSGNTTEGGTTYNSQGQVLGPNGRPVDETGKEQPASAGEQWAGAGFSALAGISKMSASGSFMGSGIMQATTQIAAMLATLGQYWIAAIVEVIGGIVEALSPRPADMQATYSGPAMAAAIKEGRAFGSEGSDTQVATTAALTLSNSMLDFFSTMFKNADPNFSRDILKGFRDQMLAYVNSIGTFGAHAGGGADFKADIQKIFTDILPKEMMHAFFGQVTNSLADPGGVTGVNLAPGGKWGISNQFSAVDAKSPLVKFLTDLGFTIDKVNEIAGQIDVMAPADFQKYFSGIVGAVIDFKNNIKNLSQSWADIQKTINDIAHPDVVAQFTTVSAGLIQMASDLSLYSGQDQIDKAKELNTASDTFYQNALKALQALQDMINAITAQVTAFNDQVNNYSKSPEGLANDRSGQLTSQYWLQGFATNDPAQLQTIWNQFMADATAQLNYFVGLYNTFTKSLTTVTDLTKSFGELEATIGRNALDINTITSDFHKYELLLGSLSTYLSTTDPSSTTYFSGLQAITDQVGVSLGDLYGEIQSFLNSVYSAQQGLNSSASQNIWQNNYMIAGNTPKNPAEGARAQEGLIRSQITQDLSDIKGATDPSVVTQKSQDIYRLLGLYEGFFKPGDPGYNDAYGWANNIITQLTAAGTTTLTGLGVSASGITSALGPGGRDAVSATNLVTAAVNQVKIAIDVLDTDVKNFADYMKGKLGGTADSIVTQLNAVSTALVDAMTLFTNALTGNTGPVGPPGPTGGPGKGDVPTAVANLGIATTGAIGDDTSGLVGFTSALNEARHALVGG